MLQQSSSFQVLTRLHVILKFNGPFIALLYDFISLRCGENEGDCDWDDDCEGSLICGSNNCLETRNSHAMYDLNDDCCERRCKPNHPCDEGEGHCESNSDCAHPWLNCGDNNCKDQHYFPQEQFFWNYIVDIFSDSDNCCYRPCRPQAKCDVNVYGCLQDDDCQDGLYCDKDKTCRDINECDKMNGKIDGYIYCGRYVDCVNYDKYYDCNCQTGYHNFVAYEGCSDIDECAAGSASCGFGEMCINTIGSYVCVCEYGFTGTPGSCTDVDECSKGTHSCSPLSVLNYEGIGLAAEFSVHEYDRTELSNSSKSFEFDLSYTGSNTIGIGSNLTQVFYRINFKSSVKLMKYTDGKLKNLAEKSLSILDKGEIPNFVHYWADFEPSGDSMVITIGAHNRGNILLSYTDSQYSTNPIIVDSIKFKNIQGEAFWRNVQLGSRGGLSTCVNTVGSYICSPSDSYRMAIGYGGHTRASGTTYPNELQVITDKVTVCGSHTIPPLSKQLWNPGMAEVNGWLYVCGGWRYPTPYPTSECNKYDLASTSSSWQVSPSMPNNFAVYSMMVSISGYIYVMGGEYHGSVTNATGYVTPISNSLSTNYQFNPSANSWTTKTGLPYAVHRAALLADEQARRIYMLGGHEMNCCDKGEVYYYNIDDNNWHHHSHFPRTRPDSTCQIIYSKTDIKLLICAIAHEHDSVWQYNLDENKGWYHMGNFRHNYYIYKMFMLGLNRYDAILVGGYSQLRGTSTKNLWTYDKEDRTFYEKFYYLQSAAQEGTWTTVKKSRNFRALQNCQAESRTYAAVGWGGYYDSWSTKWHVFLRSRRDVDPGKLSTCHGMIPDLLQSRKLHGITAVGYKLLVCGGKTKGEIVVKSCFKFETNQPHQNWQEIDSMIDARANAVMLSYGDAAYAIGGVTEDGKSTDKVEKWTELNGWESCSKIPINVRGHCGVADERFGNLFVGGGRKGESKTIIYNDWFKYNVASNQWVTIKKSVYPGGALCGATIIEQRNNGHRLLIMVGDYKNVINYIDLTVLHNTGSASWSYVTSAHNSDATSLVSLSAHEALEVSF